MKKFLGSLAFFILFCVFFVMSVSAAGTFWTFDDAADVQTAPQTEDLFSIAIIVLAIASGIFAFFFRKGKNA